LTDVKGLLTTLGLQIWTNHVVPSNDGGISLGQAALAALATPGTQATFEASDFARAERAT